MFLSLFLPVLLVVRGCAEIKMQRKRKVLSDG
jgi:hypothetical protein